MLNAGKFGHVGMPANPPQNRRRHHLPPSGQRSWGRGLSFEVWRGRGRRRSRETKAFLPQIQAGGGSRGHESCEGNSPFKSNANIPFLCLRLGNELLGVCLGRPGYWGKVGIARRGRCMSCLFTDAGGPQNSVDALGKDVLVIDLILSTVRR